MARRTAERSTGIAASVSRFRDTCNVYVLRSGRDAILVDAGSAAILDHLDELGVDRITDVLVTHHHRDQVQGLPRLAEAGARIWVPPVERDLVEAADEHWQARAVANDYDLRQDRFSLLESVPVAGVVSEYRTIRYGDHDVYTLPTPGHTIGSVTYLVEVAGRRLAFSGDLLYGSGKVLSLAATQWSYVGVEGQAATILSCAILGDHAPDVVLPAHGEPIEDPRPTLELTQMRLTELMEMRREVERPWDFDAWLRRPWDQLSPHLLQNRTSLAHSYALLSESRAALLIDWGYDLTTGTVGVTERATRRPLLATLGVLKRDFGVERIETAITTHYHDDHVAGLNLLRDIEGAEVWSPENVAPILEDPLRYDLPCLWYDPIRVDRTLEHRTPVRWHEYELTTYPLPGHTLHAAAIAFEVDGLRVLATGDQLALFGGPDGPDILNYQYRNRFRIDDYVETGGLLRELRPDLLVTGHWPPRKVTDAYVERIAADGARVAELHRELLPLADVAFDAEGFGARIEPYRSSVAAGSSVELDVAVRNPFDRAETAAVRIVVPDGWTVSPETREVGLEPLGEGSVRFTVVPAGTRVRRARVAADLTVGDVPFGQQAKALVDVT
jgi:glyoxylase-like metal-dependent hydrolase (beta-lactamase superfamily II)